MLSGGPRTISLWNGPLPGWSGLLILLAVGALQAEAAPSASPEQGSGETVASVAAGIQGAGGPRIVVPPALAEAEFPAGCPPRGWACVLELLDRSFSTVVEWSAPGEVRAIRILDWRREGDGGDGGLRALLVAPEEPDLSQEPDPAPIWDAPVAATEAVPPPVSPDLAPAAGPAPRAVAMDPDPIQAGGESPPGSTPPGSEAPAPWVPPVDPAGQELWLEPGAAPP